MKTTASEVVAAWSEIADLFDPTQADPVATALLRNPQEHAEAIGQAVEHIKLIDQTEGGLLATMDYVFCLEPQTGLWRRGLEAILQARALQQILVWSSHFPADREALQRVVVRHTFYPGFQYVTPLLRLHGRFKFIVMPYVYQELLLLPAAALAELVGGQDGADPWQFLDNPSLIKLNEASPPRSFRKLVARILTSEVFDPNSGDENPVAALSSSSDWFAGVDNDHQPGSLETVLGYSGQDFALSHEMGHCLTAGAASEHLASEVEADTVGFRLFVLSSGWRDEVLEECPLGSSVRTLLGPIWFFFTARLLFEVRQRLRSRVRQALDCDTGFFGTSQDETHVNLLVSRWKRMHHGLSHYSDVVKAFGGTFTKEDDLRIANLVEVLNAFTRNVENWLTEMPGESLLEAVRLVRPKAQLRR